MLQTGKEKWGKVSLGKKSNPVTLEARLVWVGMDCIPPPKAASLRRTQIWTPWKWWPIRVTLICLFGLLLTKCAKLDCWSTFPLIGGAQKIGWAPGEKIAFGIWLVRSWSAVRFCFNLQCPFRATLLPPTTQSFVFIKKRRKDLGGTLPASLRLDSPVHVFQCFPYLGYNNTFWVWFENLMK